MVVKAREMAVKSLQSTRVEIIGFGGVKLVRKGGTKADYVDSASPDL